MISANEELKRSLAAFSEFSAKLKGDEKSEAQTFLEHLFRAFGHAGVVEAGATFEFRVAKKPGTQQLELLVGKDAVEPAKKKGGVKFADLLWPSRVLIEMKSRGVKLEKHYDQLFDYWSHIVPHRPQYAILSNFDEIWIYDFTQQLFDPVDRIFVSDIADSRAALTFLSPQANYQKPIFDNDRVDVTRKAADVFAKVFKGFIARDVERTRAQRFVLQLLVSVVAEDLGLLPDQFVTRLLGECADRPSDSYELLGGLFRQMADEKRATGGRYKDVLYFNGGLFDEVEPIELRSAEAHLLHDSARHNRWAKVKPEVFGTIFQQSMDEKERHAFGAHFTSEFDIQKVVGPTITRPWRERIKAAGASRKHLAAVLKDLRQFRVLDPACGSGNFLFVAYREIKRLERDLLVRLRDAGEQADKLVSAISLTNFFGLDVVQFAVELTKVTLMLAKELEIREAAKTEDSDGLHLPEQPLPLDNLDKQIVRADALFTTWPKADAIIGNPPYLGSRYIAKEHGYDYVGKLYAKFPDAPRMADFCTHWFRIAHDALPKGGRAGFVGTNSIRQNESREASLDYIVLNGGTITEAVSTAVWSGDASVHVSIVNWVKGDAAGEKTLHTQEGDSVDSPWCVETLTRIPPTLKNETEVTSAIVLDANANSKKCFTGQNPVNAGFFLDQDQAAALLKADKRNREVIFPYMIGRDLVEKDGPTRWIIDFAQRDKFAAMAFTAPWEWVKERAMPIVLERAEKEKKAKKQEVTRYTRIAERWWQFYDYRPGTIAAINSVPRWIALSRTSKRPIFEFVHREIHADSKLMVFAFADDYSFGILSSAIHWQWTVARGSTLKGDQNYTSDTIFDTFPWPQRPSKKQLRAVADAAVSLRKIRRDAMNNLSYSLRDIYRTLEEPGDSPLRTAHLLMDTSVREAYGMKPKDDPLAYLLALNLECAAAEKTGKKITPPGLPLPAKEHAAYITKDCISLPSEDFQRFVQQAREGVRLNKERVKHMKAWQIREQILRNVSS